MAMAEVAAGSVDASSMARRLNRPSGIAGSWGNSASSPGSSRETSRGGGSRLMSWRPAFSAVGSLGKDAKTAVQFRAGTRVTVVVAITPLTP